MRQPMILVAPLAMFAFATSVLAGGAGWSGSPSIQSFTM